MKLFKKRVMVIFMILTGSFLSSLLAFAPEYIGISYSRGYMQKVKISNPSTASINGEKNYESSVDFSEQNFTFGATFPIEFNNKKTIIINTFEYYSYDFDFTGVNLEQAGLRSVPDKIHFATGLVLISHNFFGKWSLEGSIGTELYSGFKENITKRGIGVLGSFGASWSHSDDLILSFGLSQSYAFDKNIFLPYAIVDWKYKKVNIFFVFPKILELTYQFFPEFEMGIFGNLTFQYFSLNKKEYELSNPNISYTTIDLGPILKFHYDEWFHLMIHGGKTVLNNIVIRDEQQTIQKYDFKNSWFLNVGFILGF